MKVNNSVHLNEPQFLSGFRYAKKLLLQLRDEQLGNMSPIPNYRQAPPQSSIKQTKTLPQEQINISINRIGKELQAAYRDVEAYQIVFNKLEQYYRSKKHVIEEGELLKIKSRQLKDILADYHRKTEVNNEQISKIETQSQQFHCYVVASLKKYFTELTDCETLTLAKQVYHPQSPQVNMCKIESTDEEVLQLRLKHASWRAEVMAKKTASKKQKVASKEQSSMQKYYQSQISTI